MQVFFSSAVTSLAARLVILVGMHACEGPVLLMWYSSTASSGVLCDATRPMNWAYARPYPAQDSITLYISIVGFCPKPERGVSNSMRCV